MTTTLNTRELTEILRLASAQGDWMLASKCHIAYGVSPASIAARVPAGKEDLRDELAALTQDGAMAAVIEATRKMHKGRVEAGAWCRHCDGPVADGRGDCGECR